MGVPSHRDSLFLRALELLQDFVAFHYDQGERDRIRAGALEILPGMRHEAQLIKDED